MGDMADMFYEICFEDGWDYPDQCTAVPSRGNPFWATRLQEELEDETAREIEALARMKVLWNR